MQIDVIIWEDAEAKTIAASAVSLAGCRALAGVMGLPAGAICGSTPLDVCPDEFMSYMPKSLHVYFYKRAENTMTNMSELASKKLQ